jgi:hypothetical protein
MPIVAHALQNPGRCAIEIQQNVAGILAVGVGMDVDVAAFAVADAQETYGGGMEQLGGAPQPFSGKGPTGPVVNQAHQVQVVRHGCQLAADGLYSEQESATSIGRHFFLRRAAVSCSLSRTR